MMNVYDSKEMCCGCTACASICPKNAIEMNADEKGFLYPKIQESLCVNCGLCRSVCDFQRMKYQDHSDLDSRLIYAVKHKDINERMTSRSGGMFMALCDYVLLKKGVVYGVAFTDNLKVAHIRAETKEEVNRFKGSKYVQSNLNKTFEKVKEDLLNGKVVMFSGTGCQVAGLKSFLKNINTEKLITVDIVCHGVPSPKFFEDYISYLEKNSRVKITEFNFRDKYFGWSPHIEGYVAKRKFFSDMYTYLFYEHIMFRPSCSKCRYANLNRPADITLADFWGIDKAIANFNDNKGVSLIIISSIKGKKIFDSVSGDIEYKESNINDCMQPNLKQPSIFSPKTEEFWKDYIAHGIEFVMRKYGNLNFKSRLKFKLKVFLYKHNIRGM